MFDNLPACRRLSRKLQCLEGFRDKLAACRTCVSATFGQCLLVVNGEVVAAVTREITALSV